MSQIKRECEFFWSHRQPRLHGFVACYILLLTKIMRRLWSVTLEWIEFGCVHRLYLEELDCVPAVRRPKLVSKTGLIVSQYDRLTQQQLSFLLLLHNPSALFIIKPHSLPLSLPTHLCHCFLLTHVQHMPLSVVPFLYRIAILFLLFFSVHQCSKLYLSSYFHNDDDDDVLGM